MPCTLERGSATYVHAVVACPPQIGEFVLASAPFKTLMCYLAATIHDYEHK